MIYKKQTYRQSPPIGDDKSRPLYNQLLSVAVKLCCSGILNFEVKMFELYLVFENKLAASKDIKCCLQYFFALIAVKALKEARGYFGALLSNTELL